MARPSPMQFIAQVRAEASKVVWPNRKEVALTTVMVLILSMIVAIFFFFVDWFLGFAIKEILAVG